MNEDRHGEGDASVLGMIEESIQVQADSVICFLLANSLSSNIDSVASILFPVLYCTWFLRRWSVGQLCAVVPVVHCTTLRAALT